jgi:hypothetical protein
VLLPRRWVVERSFGWLNRFRRLTRDYERLPETLAGLHFIVFAMLMLVHFANLSNSCQHALGRHALNTSSIDAFALRSTAPKTSN